MKRLLAHIIRFIRTEWFLFVMAAVIAMIFLVYELVR